MSTPAKLKHTIYQGATFRKRLRWSSKATGTPIDLTGCTARMQVRTDFDSTAALLTLNTENAGITLGGPAGTVDLFISAGDTAAITWDGGVWDLELVHPSGDVTRLAEGSVSVSPEVTRD